MSKALHVKWPWEMVEMDCIQHFIDAIKGDLPPDHELQKHVIYPGIKWDGRLLYIVDDDTTGQKIMMDLERMKRWKKTRYKIPHMRIFKNLEEVAETIERDHHAECAKYNPDGTLKDRPNSERPEAIRVAVMPTARHRSRRPAVVPRLER